MVVDVKWSITIGEILNERYRLLDILGTGRCSKTFLAEDTQAQ